jgi:hypothetical protein
MDWEVIFWVALAIGSWVTVGIIMYRHNHPIERDADEFNKDVWHE